MTDSHFVNVRNDPKKIQLERLSHVYYIHPNLAAFEKFAADFGLSEVWRDATTVLYAGYGPDQYCYVANQADKGVDLPTFGGAAFIAQSEAEFEKAVTLAGKPPRSLSPWPGGGKIVTLETPAKHKLHVVYGQQEKLVASKVDIAKQAAPYNGSIEKPRKGDFQRFKLGPALVHKVGHVGYAIAGSWEAEMEWYSSNFNFVPSDVQYLPHLPEVDLIAFLHLDLGERFSDHHSLFLVRAPPGSKEDFVHHSSYEVEDFDTELLGHQWLKDQGYRELWGVGRHILGSQIFDYWQDPSGFKIEHYADGDLVNCHTKTTRTAAESMAVWGPKMPDEFGIDTRTRSTV